MKAETENTDNYQFKVQDAIDYGVDAAIMLHNFRFWIIKNKANKRHFHDGYYWTYNSVKAFQELFPFYTIGQIRGILQKLEKAGVIGVGNYNESKYDKTKWYCLKLQTDLLEITNGSDENDKPIPDNKTDSKQDNNLGAVKNFKKFTKEQFANDIKECHERMERKNTKDRLRDFYLYWTEPNPYGIMRFQLQPTWETGRRLATWRDKQKEPFKEQGSTRNVLN